MVRWNLAVLIIIRVVDSFVMLDFILLKFDFLRVYLLAGRQARFHKVKWSLIL